MTAQTEADEGLAALAGAFAVLRDVLSDLVAVPGPSSSGGARHCEDLNPASRGNLGPIGSVRIAQEARSSSGQGYGTPPEGIGALPPITPALAGQK